MERQAVRGTVGFVVRWWLHGGCTRWFEEVRGSRRFVRRVEPGSFIVVRVLASELELSAAGPCVSRRHVPPGHEAAHGTQGSPLSLFLFHLGFCVCVCREASSAK